MSSPPLPPPPPPVQPRWISSRGPCAGCKHLRRKCQPDCIFAPYFPASDTDKFSAVHRVFGASNAAKILLAVPVRLRQVTANSLVFEARERCNNLVFGTCEQIAALNQQIRHLEQCIQNLKQQIRRQELHILQMLRQRGGGLPNQTTTLPQQQPAYGSPPVTIAIAPTNRRPRPATVLEPGFRQQLEQNNSSGYLIDRGQSSRHPTTIMEPGSRHHLEQNDSSRYSAGKIPEIGSRQQPEQNNSSRNLSDRVAAKQLYSHSRQQVERNNNSGYLSDKVAAKQFCSQSSTVPESSSRQQVEQNNSSRHLIDDVATFLEPSSEQ